MWVRQGVCDIVMFPGPNKEKEGVQDTLGVADWWRRQTERPDCPFQKTELHFCVSTKHGHYPALMTLTDAHVHTNMEKQTHTAATATATFWIVAHLILIRYWLRLQIFYYVINVNWGFITSLSALCEVITLWDASPSAETQIRCLLMVSNAITFIQYSKT